MKLYEDLKLRDLIKQTTVEDLEENFKNPQSVYCGFDPTGETLHVGHLLAITTLKRFEKAGFTPLVLLGTATGMIGDPSGKKTERSFLDNETLEKNTNAISEQLGFFFKEENIFRNGDWISKMSAIEFLQKVGKHFPINYMLAKESVKSRIETGISYTEFSYMLIQAYDFYHLNKHNDCTIQIGGSDQFGNMTSGVEYIKRKSGKQNVVCMTFPLILKSDGTKFGKTEGGAIWLNKKNTTPYEFYQFFFNTSDADVIKFIKYFTFLEASEINDLEKQVKDNPREREAQKVLAEKITVFVHGEESLVSIKKASEVLFKGDITALTENEIEEFFVDVPQYKIKNEITIIDLLIESNLAKSKREGIEFLESSAIKVNGEAISDANYAIVKEKAIHGKYFFIKRGKKKNLLVEMI